MEVHRGEVFYADLSPVVGSEQGGIRPVLIVQNEIGNRHSPTVIAAAITSRLDKARLPTHINIRAADTGLAKDSVVLLEQIRTLDKHRLRERAGQITPEDQKRVDQALDVSLGVEAYWRCETEKGLPVRAVPFVVLGQSSFFRVLSASWSRAYSRIFSSVCSLRICSALQASSAAMSSSTPSCTKKWVSSRWRL